MNVIQRIKKILFALVMIAAAVVFIIAPPEYSLVIIVAILSLGFAAKSIMDIIFYFRMARHMVGGKLILFKGVLMLDLALLSLSLYNIPTIFILLYLIGIYAFSGVIDILRALESRKAVEGPWKLKFSHGLVNIALAVVCLIFINSMLFAVLIYSAGLIYSAVMRIISAFRKTAFVVIQ